MTRNELERYLGRCVTITLLDNTVIEGTLHMSIDEMARSCMEFSTVRTELRMSAVLWKSDLTTSVLTAQNIGLKVR